MPLSNVPRPQTRVLIFNQQGYRDSINLLEVLAKMLLPYSATKPQHVIFCPTPPKSDTAGNQDFVNLASDNRVGPN